MEDGAKIFGLPVVCRAVGPDKFFTDIYFAHSFGYCFAGSVTMGQNSYLAMAPLLTTLISEERYIPSLEDVASYAQRFLTRSFDAYKTHVAESALFEAALFGWCHVTKALEMWHFRPIDSTGVWQMTKEHVTPITRGAFLYLGSHKGRVIPKLQEAMANDNAMQRAPRRVIQELIRDESYPEIGGAEQLAIANEYGLQAYSVLQPPEPGKPQGHLSYLGIELRDDNAAVGRARVGGPGMA
jgi:hypothetical protein